jgi:hypothetical protein
MYTPVSAASASGLAIKASANVTPAIRRIASSFGEAVEERRAIQARSSDAGNRQRAAEATGSRD